MNISLSTQETTPGSPCGQSGTQDFAPWRLTRHEVARVPRVAQPSPTWFRRRSPTSRRITEENCYAQRPRDRHRRGVRGKQVEITSRHTATIKKYATGKGNAKKPHMLDAAKARWTGIVDDNHADALWLLALVTSEMEGC